MNAQPSLIMIQFLQWVANRPRRREDVMAAWPSSCPRFPVWEDACAEGLVRLHGYKRTGRVRSDHEVALTERGRSALAQALGNAPAGPPSEASQTQQVQPAASGSGP